MIWTAAEAQEIDRLSSAVHNIPSLDLMESAGLKTFHLALRLWKPYSHFVILAGAANNGGDALVVARLLAEAKFSFEVIDLSNGKESPERKEQSLRLEALGVKMKPFGAESFAHLKGKDLILIDGLLGLGLKGKLRPGPVADCLKAAATLKAKVVLAIDLPSGLDADLFEQEPALLPATHTITFGEKKPLHVSGTSKNDCGEVHRVRLDFAPEAIQSVIQKRSYEYIHTEKSPRLSSLWSFLPADAHKYDRGHVLAIGGSPGKVGAIMMSAQAALKAGAGWVSVAPMSEYLAPAWQREFTYESFALEGEIELKPLEEFIEKRKVKAILIGPGTMENPLNPALLAKLSVLQKKLKLRLIFDAGALSDLFELSKGLTFDPENTLLTPHPGEWQRLSKGEPLPKPEGISDLAGLSQRLARAGFSAIYKSASPIILTKGKAIFLSLGDNRLGRAGSGDILAGLILGLAATPHSLVEIAAIAQNMLAQASRTSEHSLSPLEVLNAIAL